MLSLRYSPAASFTSIMRSELLNCARESSTSPSSPWIMSRRSFMKAAVFTAMRFFSRMASSLYLVTRVFSTSLARCRLLSWSESWSMVPSDSVCETLSLARKRCAAA